MKEDTPDRRGRFGWGLSASFAAHLAVALLLIFGLPLPFFEAEQEKAVDVELVPPPAEQPKKADPPATPKQEEKQEAKAEPLKPEPPKPEPKPEEAARPAPQKMLQPVFRFGEKDGGPRQALDGDAARETLAPPPAALPAQEEQQPAQPPALAAAKAGDEAAAAPEPKPAASDAKAAETPAPQPPKKDAPSDEKPGKLFSRSATGDAVATTAAGEVPRGVRAGRLCVSVLRERMRNTMPPYFPDLLPSYRLPSGNVLQANRAAFRMNGEWYDLIYRCEVDDDATRVLSFDFEVGGRVPPSDWARRGLPAR